MKKTVSFAIALSYYIMRFGILVEIFDANQFLCIFWFDNDSEIESKYLRMQNLQDVVFRSMFFLYKLNTPG